MIDPAFAELVPAISITATCRRLGKSKATHYRRQHPKQPRPRTPHPTPPNALTEAERTAVLAVLTSPRFVDSSVAQMTAWAAEKAAMFLRRHPEASEVLKRMQENIRLAVRSYRFREGEGRRIAAIQAIRDNADLFSDPEAVHRFREIADILASPPNETF